LTPDRIKVLSITKSKVFECNCDVNRTITNTYNNTVHEKARTCYVTSRVYQRSPLANPDISVGLSDRFGKKQLSLAVALLLQKR